MTAPRDKNRSLPQDLAFGTNIQRWLQESPGTEFRWLDVACGDGSLLRQSQNLFEEEDLNLIRYTGIDIDVNHCRLCDKHREDIGLSGAVQVTDLSDISRTLEQAEFDGITLVNVLHELPRAIVPELLADLLSRLKVGGFLYVFDVANIPYADPEPGSLTWTREEMSSLLKLISREIGLVSPVRVQPYRSRQGGWQFTTTHLEEKHRDSAGLLLQSIKSNPENFTNLISRLTEKRRIEIDNGIRNLTHKLFENSVIDPDFVYSDEGRMTRDQIDVSMRDFWACATECDSISNG